MRALDAPAGWGWVTPGAALDDGRADPLPARLRPLDDRGVPDLLARFTLTQTHKSWGTVVFVLALVRVAWRLANRARPPLPPMPRWQVRAARASHALLYLFMFLMPLSGWLLASASPVQDLLQMQNLVFGRLAPPRPLRPRQRRGSRRRLHRLHATAAIGLAALLALHAAAALKHQFVDRDGLLARMLSGAGRVPVKVSVSW